MSELLREKVVLKLKGCNAYVDNELPDYIMVMLANHKTVAQIGEDLQLFLGDNTERFTSWLQTVLSDPSLLQKKTGRGERGGGERQREGEGDVQDEEGGGGGAEHLVGEEGREGEGGENRNSSEGGGGEKRNNSGGGVDKRVSGGGGGRNGRRLEQSAGEVGKDRGGGKDSDHGGARRSREGAPPTSQQSRTRKRTKMENYSDEERRLPSPKFSRMRSDRYEYEREKAEATRFRRDRVPRRPLEEPQRSLQPQRLRMSSKKTVRAQPDSTRDQDLRELIGGRRHSEARSYLHRKDIARGKSGKVESEGEEEEDDESAPTTTIASVVRLVGSSRPKRTDEGGSRLLHKAILGLRPKRGENTSTFSRGGVSKREKVILIPASMLGDCAPENIVLTNKIVQDTAILESRQRISSTHVEEEEVELENEEEEVIVELDGTLEREFDEEEEEEYRMEEMRQEEDFKKEEEKMVDDALISPAAEVSVVKVLNSIRSSSGTTSSASRERDAGGRDMDLRTLISRSRAGRVEGQRTRFVVTLGGLDTTALPGHAVEAEGISPEITPEVTVVAKKSAKERLGVKTIPVEAMGMEMVPVKVEVETMKEGNGGIGLSDLPEKCRFWPNCKNGDKCPFHHPTIPCKLFPDCKFGKNCLFLHPKCKFDSRCSRNNCSYLHTVPRHLAVKTQQPMMSSVPLIAPQMIPTPIPFRPPLAFNPSYSYSGVNPSPRSWSMRYPSKSAMSWKPSSHISERKFAVEEPTFNLPT